MMAANGTPTLTRAQATDEKVRFVRRKVADIDKNITDVRECLEGFGRNQERLRRKTAKLSLALRQFGDSETPELSRLLQSLSESLSEESKARQLMQERVEIRCAQPLNAYKLVTKKIKEDLKARDNALSKEMKKQRALDQVTIKEPGNVSRISHSQIELATASQEVVNTTNALSVDMVNFEARKTHDLKACFNEFIYSQMAYHARAIEILTKAHQNVLESSFDSDLESVRQILDLTTFSSAAAAASASGSVNNANHAGSQLLSPMSTMSSPLSPRSV